ncbi:methylated-DNA--[protein]-cysteine S-methyltransferase [Lactiplantibacillus sp. WILCCON 0030]|uniref:Methylated-DNA--[protein]-cysteine S-methyltransferase n=1 Tax=Lactiplantibacillus brownii TaxID=3069269 RepID=A0ABU1AB59_9LACO|nr:methylated-DNA--[protein]-cysteine S-methyltransferase [Lactiplantibacillus brownii]MDQ7938155.1 methylated-DNA--[protein]-cysteine S-methyltransferase [Lactiplantibacillus brownii]
MQLTLSQVTINQQTFWLGSTLQGLAFVGRANGPANEWRDLLPTATSQIDPAANQVAGRALADYLNGQKTEFSLPLDLSHGTPFQQQVWQALREVPYGATWTYSELAHKLQRPTATRAIASAVGRNPLLMVVPCHRIVRKDGQLGGYRGGLIMKQQLQQLERVNPTESGCKRH